jgi:1-acyl-sn-glycerol-3-phosphate acyltransferase
MFRATYLMIWLIIFLPLIALSELLPQKPRYEFHLYVSKVLARLFRLKVKVTGRPSAKKPVLFVSNHISYTDILVLGAVLPGKFVSKAEVAKWPVIGQIAKLSGTLFINRRKSAAGNHLKQIEDALFIDKKNLIIFPEGTTGDGRAVLPFKSSLFKIAENMPEGQKLTIQPVTIEYTHINGLPVQANERKKIAWIGDASFGPHFREFVNLGMVRVHVTIHPPLKELADRKSIALQAQAAVSASLNN